MKYKNKTKDRLVIVGVGVVEPEGIIETKKEINNPNLVEVKEEIKEVENKIKKDK